MATEEEMRDPRWCWGHGRIEEEAPGRQDEEESK